MAPDTGYVKYFDLQLYDEGFVLILPRQKNPDVLEPFEPQDKIFHVQKESQEWAEKILEKRKARAEGLAEGRAEGRTEGQTITLIQQMKKKIQKSKTLIQIADELEEEPDTIQSLYECVSQNINLATEEIYKIYISPDKTED